MYIFITTYLGIRYKVLYLTIFVLGKDLIMNCYHFLLRYYVFYSIILKPEYIYINHLLLRYLVLGNRSNDIFANRALNVCFFLLHTY